ncbi:MAG: UDP-4-amino-4,6-dideoxy-N-acetyl-beta-L-altrosamine N-acetyltransferase [Syntrophomonadaceae bacterium]|nr:UDP-4-amino-4,6-dideoxy-N-acetyl-beta-L-altrosamine N-acetyltransferase [Syntrophomonadaceae bacterium]
MIQTDRINIADGKLRPMQLEDLEIVLRWRNSERVRSYMFSDHIISLEEHKEWFKYLDSKRNVYLVFEYNQAAAGLVCFNDIDNKNGLSYWGFYLGETNIPPGTGLLMGYLSMEYAFNILQTRKLCSRAFRLNERSIKFHKKLGFKREGCLKSQILRNGIYEDVIELALFNCEWAEIKNKIKEALF